MPHVDILTLSGPQPLWTVKRLAQALELSEDWVYKAAQRGEIPCVRIGSSVRFHYKEIVAWLNSRRGNK